ncbi:MAG: L-2-amino-thiazoline-4-carboxylic acid hydrolase [Candidatus Thorarchaeota archaeon]
MLEKKICSNYDENATMQISIKESLPREMKLLERFLNIVSKHDESIIQKLLEKYRKDLLKMKITSEPSEFVSKLQLDYTQNKWLNVYPHYFSLIENAFLHFLQFNNYKSTMNDETQIESSMFDIIRGEFHPLYYLIYSLVDLTSRDFALQLAKEFTELTYEIYKDQIFKRETLEEMAKFFYEDGCPNSHNLVSKVEDGKYYLKIKRCWWGDAYKDLPDLELASLLECYGDFCKMIYVNPNFTLTRTRTLVEGNPFCDFVHHDKRIVKEIIHPDDEFWKNFD